MTKADELIANSKKPVLQYDCPNTNVSVNALEKIIGKIEEFKFQVYHLTVENPPSEKETFFRLVAWLGDSKYGDGFVFCYNDVNKPFVSSMKYIGHDLSKGCKLIMEIEDIVVVNKMNRFL